MGRCSLPNDFIAKVCCPKDRVHQNLAVEVEGDIVGLAASADLGYDWKGKAIVPRLVRVVQIGEVVLHISVCSCHSVKVLNLLLHMRFSLREGLQKLRVAGRLIAAQAGLLIHNQLRYQGRLRDAGIGILDEIDGRIGVPDLQVERARDHQEGHHRQQKYLPQNGAEYPRSQFGTRLLQIAQLIKANVGLEIAFADVGGWDTHVNQGSSTGQLAQRLDDFSRSIAALVTDLGDKMDDVVILTMSEFGRMAKENGNRGTDHGHAGALLVIGGHVKGGKVHGKWPGLEQEQLYEGRDLALTTDFRSVFAEIVQHHLGARALDRIFPGFAAAPRDFLGLV